MSHYLISAKFRPPPPAQPGWWIIVCPADSEDEAQEIAEEYLSERQWNTADCCEYQCGEIDEGKKDDDPEISEIISRATILGVAGLLRLGGPPVQLN